MKTFKAYVVLISILPVLVSGQSYVRAIEGKPIVHYGKTRDDITVTGGKLLANPFAVTNDVTWEKSKNMVVKSMRQIYVHFEEGTGMVWGEGSTNWVFYINDSLRMSRNIRKVKPAIARKFADLPKTGTGDNEAFWGMISVSSVDGKDSRSQESYFTDVVFHEDSTTGLILGLITSKDSRMFIPPVIISLTPFLVLSLQDAEKGTIDLDQLHNIELPKSITSDASSTDIEISEGGDGTLVAKGRIEFLLLGWGKLYRNYGEGTRVRIAGILKTPLELVDWQNKVTSVTSGAYIFSNGKWNTKY